LLLEFGTPTGILFFPYPLTFSLLSLDVLKDYDFCPVYLCVMAVHGLIWNGLALSLF